MKKIKKKASMSLLEIMIVIFLIGIISSVIGFSMKGSLEKGKAYKTKAAIEKIYDLCQLRMAEGVSVNTIVNNVEEQLKETRLVSNTSKLLKDGWGNPLTITITKNNDDIRIESTAYTAYLTKNNTPAEYPWDAN